MVEEDKRKKLPPNWEARKRKIDWEVAEEEARKVSKERMKGRFGCFLFYVVKSQTNLVYWTHTYSKRKRQERTMIK